MVKGDNVNVDRLDYSLRDLKSVSRIYQLEYASIVNNLVVGADGKIRCQNIDTARLLFTKFLEANREIYFDPKAEAAALTMAAILKEMLREGFLTQDDFLLTDDDVIAKILKSPFRSVFETIGPSMKFALSATPTAHPPVLRKLRYIDPEVVDMPGRLTDRCVQSRKALEAYLKMTPTTVYYHIPALEERYCL